MAEADESFRRHLETQIQRGITSGEIRSDVNPAAQSALLVAALRGISIQRLINSQAFDLKTIASELHLNIERTLRNPSVQS